MGVPVTSNGYRIRRGVQSAPDSVPAGALQVVPFGTFNFTGGAPNRNPAINVTAGSQQVAANPAEYTEVSGRAECDSLYGHYDIERAAVCGQSGLSAGVSVTATTISAVVSGGLNVLRHGTGGAWNSFRAGDMVRISGQTTNGADYCAFVASTPTGSDTDLPLVAAYKTLSAEAAGASITVKYESRIRMGTDLPLLMYEAWHIPTGSRGDEYLNTMVTSWGWSMDFPGPIRESFAFVGGKVPIPLAAALANGSTDAPAQHPANSNVMFGAKLAATGFGGGFRYGGVLMPNLRISKLSRTITRPGKTSGGAGEFGPRVAFTDGLFQVQYEMEVMRDCDEAEDLRSDALDPSTVTSFGWAVRDALGRIYYDLAERVEPAKGDTGGLKRDGEDAVTLSFVGSVGALTGSMFQRTYLGLAA